MNPLALAILGVVVLALTAALAHAPWKLSFGFWLVVPAVAVLVQVLQPDPTPSRMVLVKAASMCLAAALLCCVPLLRALPRRVGGTITLLILGGNIAGSGLKAYNTNGTWAPVVAGALLILGIGGWSATWVSEDPQEPVLRVDLGWAWVLGFAAYVAAVVHDNPVLYPMGRQLVTVGVSLILAALWGQARWLAIRIHSLALVFTGFVLFPELYAGPLATPDLQIPGGAQGLGALAALLALPAVWRNGARWLRPMVVPPPTDGAAQPATGSGG
ncbi:MAG: hypothetical protein H6739_38560 [Alphaproteobacteria bacterium]|nr:hypothetical protein [Alphaproteobacteria bacterium]